LRLLEDPAARHVFVGNFPVFAAINIAFFASTLASC
jgi:hypothetical protein